MSNHSADESQPVQTEASVAERSSSTEGSVPRQREQWTGPEETREPMVSVDGLKKYYGSDKLLGGKPVKAVDNVSFEIARGETLGLVGESGCGKTTLAHSLLQLEDVDEGTVTIAGQEVTSLGSDELREWRRNAQIVFQNPETSINERMTIGRIIREPLDVYDWGTKKERKERVSNLLDRVGLQPEHYYRYPHQFSGGQRQRIGIARALALEPDFIILDEPVSALDVSVQAKILNLLMDIQEDFDLTYLLIAHDLSVVRHICDRVGVMYLGKLMEVAPTEQLFQAPKNPYTKSLLSAIPEPEPEVDRDSIPLRGSPPSPRNPPAGCSFSTRCPFKIYPEEFEQLDANLLDRIEQFREVLDERDSERDSGLSRLKSRLGLSDEETGLERVKSDLFADIEMIPAVEEPIDESVALAADGEVDQATTLLDETFGGVCETESPSLHGVDEQHTSRCHRHADEYADMQTLRRYDVNSSH